MVPRHETTNMKKTNRYPLALLGWAFVAAASAQTAFVAGPVERVSPDLVQVTVLGQTYLIDAQTVFASNGRKLTRIAGTSALVAGGLVAIESRTHSSPRKAALVTVSGSPYVSGATPVFVAGQVEKIASGLGILTIGGLSVDVSAIPPEALANIEIGSFIEVAGTQPLPQALLLADGIVLISSKVTTTAESIGGTGTGTSLQSIGGTGASTSIQSIGGTGRSTSSIGGTGGSTSLQSIGGTGKSTSLQSIGGTGASTSLQSIGGTGKSTSLQSIGGTGAALHSRALAGLERARRFRASAVPVPALHSRALAGLGRARRFRASAAPAPALHSRA